ncbi:metallophosphoesterase [Sphingosinicella sp. LY1275]|uniref:metallophosphoesterase family protein n=1 Tax=Sphingosinicella sp. LY1275 TaxID=3095379 RepID=UPI002ADEAFEE|nr:metallophosphoesterase [Sphingosinicella sp. LY1275]MEA1013821.1 metallophosphoesterase [Sphingosinicella sp. LY1275]
MATIAHLSDVHFGRHDPVIVQAVEDFLAEKRPELVVISGDFTQRARVKQYEMACAFVDRIEASGLPVLAVPGNHDVPLYDVVRRFARPLHRYKRFIDDDLCPWFETDHLAVLGINTARSLTIKDGSISLEQMAIIRERFRDVPEGKTRILVTHHPLFAMPIGDEGELTKVVKRHTDALTAVAEAGVHILLAGHFHRTYASSAREMVETAGPALVVQAGTATSTRLRGEELQSFNWIEAAPQRIDLQVLRWDGAAFLPGRPTLFECRDGRWTFAGREEGEGVPAEVVAERADAAEAGE